MTSSEPLFAAHAQALLEAQLEEATEGGVEGGVEGDSGEGDSGEGDGSALEKELAMLNRAREYALRRTVVKRPKNAPPLGNAPPSHSVEGSTNRFDVYLA